MKPLQIFYPFKPFGITQHWGNPNAVYATQFNNPNFKRHNGVDAAAWYPTDYALSLRYPVDFPVEGFVVDEVQDRAEGGGNEMWFVSKEPLQIGDKQAYAYMVMCHAEKIFVKPGDE